MATFSKKKLATKVKLPRTLTVPTKQTDDGTRNDTTANYILCAVQNHLGTSAHGGHYTADVLDWTTGVWYGFNDEEVSVLEDGPESSFHSSSETDKNGKVVGSADAYNLFYVEESTCLSNLSSSLKVQLAEFATESKPLTMAMISLHRLTFSVLSDTSARRSE